MAKWSKGKFRALGMSAGQAKQAKRYARKQRKLPGTIVTPKKLAKEAERVMMALAAGEPISASDVPVMMAHGDPALLELYLDQQTQQDARTLTIDAGDELAERAKLMAQPGTDPELRRMFLDQLVSPRPSPSSGSAPLGMDDDRYQLHQEAKQLAQQKAARDPRLDDGEAYILAVTEIEDRKYAGPI